MIWKWEAEMPDAPPNVLISSWLPQLDILAHPNVKVGAHTHNQIQEGEKS